MPWNIEQLGELVANRGDADRTQRCWDSLQSIVSRQKFAIYHYREFKRLVAVRFPAGRTHEQELMALFTMSDQTWANLANEREAAAHVVACLQSLHAVSDTLAQVIYLALGPLVPDLEGLGDARADMHRVFKALASSSICTNLHGLLGRLVEHPDFVYLSDVVNHVKHRRILGPNTMVDVDEDGLAVPLIELRAFDHPVPRQVRRYAARNVDDFLTSEYDRQSQCVVEAGMAINQILLAVEASATPASN